MSLIVVKSPDGAVRHFPLTKTQPVTIGRHGTCDIQIDDDGVERLHARISWAKKHFEVMSAAPQGVLVNGTAVRNSKLSVGDVIQVGGTDLLFTTEEALRGDGEKPKDDDPLDVPLKEITEEFPAWEQSARPPEASSGRTPRRSGEKPKQRVTPGSSLSDDEPGLADIDEPDEPPLDQLFDDDDDQPPPSIEGHGAISPLSGLKESSRSPDAPATPVLSRLGSNSEGEPAEPSVVTVKDEPALKKIKEALHAARQRPGQQELTRSPLFLVLGIGSLILAFGAAIFWFMINREEAARYLQAARDEREARKYTQAIKRYQEFINLFPEDDESDEARQELSRTRVLNEIDTSSPNWSAGLDELKKLIERHRDDETFRVMQKDIIDDAQKIAVGTCRTAQREHDSKYFPTSDEATKLVERFLTDADKLKLAKKEIQDARRTAEAAILKHETFQKGVAQIRKQLDGGRALDALRTRRELQQQYEEFKNDASLKKLFREALALDKSQIETHDDAPKAGERAGESPAVMQLFLTANSRSRLDEPKSGRSVYAVGGDVLFAIDTGNGDPVWSRVVGDRLPFFPIEVTTSIEGLLLFNTRSSSLELLERNAGRRVWGLPLEGTITGTPQILDGQAYLTSSDGQLWQVDLESGSIETRLTFSQPLSAAPAVIAERNRLAVVGEREVFYVLSLRPLAIESVVYNGHAAGSIVAAPLRMGPLVLIAENGVGSCRASDEGDDAQDTKDTCLLRVFDTRDEGAALKQIAESCVIGTVVDAPVIRGNQLVVPSWPERLSAYSVSAETDQPTLSLVAEASIGDKRTAAWVINGPDGQLWMVSTALRKLKLTTDSLELSADSTAEGFASQPIQMLGTQLFVGRYSSGSRAVHFSRIDRDSLSSEWRTTVGDAVSVTTEGSDGELIGLSASGEVWRIRAAALEEAGYVQRSNAQLDLDPTSRRGLLSARVADGRIAAVSAAPSPKLFVVRTTGQLHFQRDLPDEPDAAPIALGTTFVVPLPGRLHCVRNSGPSAEDYIAPVEEGTSHQWKYVIAIDDEACVAFDADRGASRLQLREQPVPNLALVSQVEMKRQVVLPPVLLEDKRLAFVDDSGGIGLLDSRLLEVLQQRGLDSPAVVGPWADGSIVFVQTADGTLHCLDGDAQLKSKWTHPLGEGRVAGAPRKLDNEWVVPLVDGRILFADAATGKTHAIRSAGQKLTGPLLEYNGALWATTLAGSIVNVGSLPEEKQ